MSSLAVRFARALLVAVWLLPAGAAAQDAKPTFTKEQLDQMVAPIALYPDSLLSQVLMAATYPADVADAAKWSKANSKQKGDAAVKAVDGQSWDPSVKSLVAFPQVIQMMGEKPDWVQNLGDAFLASSKDVLDAAQRLRAQAQKAGNLKTTEQQKVVVEPAPQAPQQTVIKIEPANPQVVYVPTYNPTVVYGAWPYPAYPPYYIPPPPGYAIASGLAAGIAFGVGVGITNALWGGCNWGHGTSTSTSTSTTASTSTSSSARTRPTSSTTRRTGAACRTATRRASSSSGRTSVGQTSGPTSAAAIQAATPSASRPNPRSSSGAWIRRRSASGCKAIPARASALSPRRRGPVATGRAEASAAGRRRPAAAATTRSAARATPGRRGSRWTAVMRAGSRWRSTAVEGNLAAAAARGRAAVSTAAAVFMGVDRRVPA